MTFFTELRRRNVFRVAIAYLVVGWLLVQVLGIATDSFEAPAWVMKLFITMTVIGFIPAVLFSWAFEMTPEGIKKESEIEASHSKTMHTAKKLDVLTLLALVLVISVLALDRFYPKEVQPVFPVNEVSLEQVRPTVKPETIQNNTIAVLPFADLSQAGDQAYFSDGIAEEILNVLVRVDALKVTSRTSAFQFKGSKKGIPAIAKELKVRHVLEGSVRKAGNNLRITAQLIDAQNDKHLWSEKFDRPLTTENIFAIQDEISNAIVDALKEELNLQNTAKIQVKQTTENLSAYELYLQARPLFLSRKKLDVADEFLIKAIELDSEYADAWAMRAALTFLKNQYGFTQLPIDETDQKGIKYANHALSLDSNSVMALAVKANILFNANLELRGSYEYVDILRDFNKALSIEPKNATTLLWTGQVYQQLGFVDKAMQLFSQCMENEPLYRPCIENYIFQHEYIGNYELSVATYLEYLSTGVVYQYGSPLVSLAALNQEVAFILGMNSDEYFKGWSRNGEIYQAYKNPQLDHSSLINEAANWANQNNKPEQYWSAVLAPIGYEPESKEIEYYPFYTVYKNINSDRIKTYLRRTNVVSYWRQHGFPPQCKPLGEDDFECE